MIRLKEEEAENKTSKKNLLLISAAGLVLVALIVVYGVFDPTSVPFPRCPFLLLTGLECPGCGSQRAIHSLLHLDIVSAWRYNALMVISIPIVILLLIAQFNRERYPKFYNRLNSKLMIRGAFLIIIIWWIGRNLL